MLHKSVIINLEGGEPSWKTKEISTGMITWMKMRDLI